MVRWRIAETYSLTHSPATSYRTDRVGIIAYGRLQQTCSMESMAASYLMVSVLLFRSICRGGGMSLPQLRLRSARQRDQRDTTLA